jgi:hypothetical protein
MARVISWLLLVLLAGGFAGVVLLLLRERSAAGRDMPEYSVYSEGRDGLGEAAHLLASLGWKPVAVTRPIQHTTHRGLFVLAGPQRAGVMAEETGGISDSEALALVNWIEQGNTLLLACGHTTALHRALGVAITETPRLPDDTFISVELAAGGGYLAGIQQLSVGSWATVRTKGSALPLWYINDRPGAVLLRRGPGRVLVLADPGLLTRHGLVRADGQPRDDNALFLPNVAALDARDDEVYFDEYHHGIRAGSGFWAYLAYHGERWALLPLLIVLAVAAWAWAVRLGPATPTPPPVQADAVEYASALARLYQRAGARRRLARTLTRTFLGELTRHLRLSRTALPAVILAAWQQQTPASADRLQGLLRGVVELRKGDVTDRRMLAWARDFDQFLKTEL